MKLERISDKPILAPTKNWWENSQVFNPGAAVHRNKVILLYRAVGNDSISRFGLATSSDGVNFETQENPIFEGSLINPLERLGVEDCRITCLGEDFVIIYTGASLYPAEEMKKPQRWQRKAPWRIRTFLTSTKDFSTFAKEKLILDFDTKDAVLFPEKQSRGFALLHRIYPDIYLSYSQELTNWPTGKKILEPREGFWDSERVGAGPTPFKTEVGWIHFYHGVDQENKYHIGLVVHDLENPEKILYRSKEPLLSPELDWEKEGFFPNVIFSCGAIEKEGDYILYYGASDKSIGAAKISKDDLLNFVKENAN
jgi:predicted GH43/DUF377 family glycosyl hydrolase